jgi:hypothetical protein
MHKMQMHQMRPVNFLHALARFVAATVLLVVFESLVTVAAHADARVSVQGDAVRLEAEDAPLSDVLTALGATYELRYPGATGLSQIVTGTYAGSAREIIAGVLAGYDYVVKSSNGKLAILVYGVSRTTPNGPTPTAVAQNAAQRVLSEAGPAPATNAIPTPTASSNAAPAATARPPSRRTGRAPVTAMLGAAARSLIPVDSESGAPAASGAAGTSGSAPPAAEDMGALTRGAVRSLESLVAALRNPPPHN